jgi:fatty acid desaturase
MAYYIALHESSAYSISFKLQSFKNIDPKRWLHFEHPERALAGFLACFLAGLLLCCFCCLCCLLAGWFAAALLLLPLLLAACLLCLLDCWLAGLLAAARARDVQSATNVLGLCF